ncbi:hypothetical protein C8R45DRAFT_215679 [Mycena sanguinolenta]|nr:hypothetical protein C8R45DRAFT_215679 [Mycena sanguinolenta]
MSSSSPPNLHLSLPPSNTSTAPVLHLSLPNTSFKRSFEHYIESPAATLPPSHESIDGSTASSSGSSMSSPDGGDENRRKRARSASTLNESEDRSSEASSSTLSSLDSDDSLSHSGSSQAPRRHLLLDLGLGRTLGSSVALGLGMAAAELQLGGRATSEPPPRIPTPELLESEDVDMPDIDLGFSRDEERDEEEEPTSPADNVRRSVDRFNAFDRHISVLRSSSPPVIPLPTSLSSRHASLSPPTLPPLPLVDLGLDPEDDDEDEPEHIPSVPTNISTTPPRLDLNLPPTSSLSPGRSSHIAPDEPPTQFRERLDSALTGIGSGGLHFEAPISPTDERVDDGPSFDSYFEPARDPLGATSAGSSSDARASASASHYHPRTLDENPLFEWSVPPALDWDAVTLAARSSGSASAANTAQSPSPWRRYIRPSNNDSNENATTSPDTTVADLRRLLGTPLPARLFPRPPSLAAPLSTTISSLDTEPLDVNLDDAYLDLRMPNSRAWESALDRARTHHQQRGRERERREREQRERERERERQIEREREEETERERDNPWQLDSIWGSSSGVESFPSAPPRPRESSLTRMRREVEEDDLARRRAVERQLRQTLERTDRMMERHNRLVYGRQSPENGPSSSMARAARYLESGLVDPREAPSASGSRDRLRPPLDTSNSFTASWTSRRATRPTEDDGSASASASRLRSSQFRSSSQSRERAMDWLGRIERDEPSPQLDLFDEWLSEHPPPRSITPAVGSSRSGAYDDQTSDYLRRNGVQFPLPLTPGGPAARERGNHVLPCRRNLRHSPLALLRMRAHNRFQARPNRRQRCSHPCTVCVSGYTDRQE